MDKTIEIVLVATVVLATAAIVLFLTNDKAKDFSSFLDGQSSEAECDLMLSQAKSQVKCDDGSVVSDSVPSEPDKWSELGCGTWNPEEGKCG